MLVVIVMLVAPLRSCFYRHANLLSGPLQPSTAVSLFALVICISRRPLPPRVDLLANNAWRAVVMSRECRLLRLTVALAVALALIAIWRLSRPGKFDGWPGCGGEAAPGPAGRHDTAARADGLVLVGRACRHSFRRRGRVLPSRRPDGRGKRSGVGHLAPGDSHNRKGWPRRFACGPGLLKVTAIWD